MKQTIDLYAFVEAFRRCGRYEQLGGREGLELLYDYLEELESGTGSEIELDVTGLCCDFACSGEGEIRDYYDIPEDVAILDYLNDRTSVVGECADGIIYQQF